MRIQQQASQERDCILLRCATTAPGIEADTPLRALCMGLVAEYERKARCLRQAPCCSLSHKRILTLKYLVCTKLKLILKIVA